MKTQIIISEIITGISDVWVSRLTENKEQQTVELEFNNYFATAECLITWGYEPDEDDLGYYGGYYVKSAEIVLLELLDDDGDKIELTPAEENAICKSLEPYIE